MKKYITYAAGIMMGLLINVNYINADIAIDPRENPDPEARALFVVSVLGELLGAILLIAIFIAAIVIIIKIRGKQK